MPGSSASSSFDSSGSADEPLFRVVRGTPTPEELAALVGVLWTRRQSATTEPPTPAPTRWRASASPRAGRLPRPAPGAWSSAR